MKAFTKTFAVYLKEPFAEAWKIEDTFDTADDALDMAIEADGLDFSIIEVGVDLHTCDVTETLIAERNKLLAERGDSPVFATAQERDDHEKYVAGNNAAWDQHEIDERRAYQRAVL